MQILHDEILKVVTPVSLAALIFSAGVFYRKVHDLTADVNHLEKDINDRIDHVKENCRLHVSSNQAINAKLIEISTTLKFVQREHKEFREELRGFIKAQNSRIPAKQI